MARVRVTQAPSPSSLGRSRSQPATANGRRSPILDVQPTFIRLLGKGSSVRVLGQQADADRFGDIRTEDIFPDALENFQIKDGSIGSIAIADGAVIEAKIADFAVTQNKIGSLSVNAAKIATGAVETAKIKDANVTLAKLAADAKFASGTKLIFPQAAAPTGWTKDTTHNGKVLRIVSGSGGGSGGSADPASTISLAHSHTVDGHVHAISAAAIAHNHEEATTFDTSSGQIKGVAENPFGYGGAATTFNLGTFAARIGPQANTVLQVTSGMQSFAAGNTDSTSPGTDSQLSNVSLAYVDAIVCTKD